MPHLRWTALRLRQVPADLTIGTNFARPEQIVELIESALHEARGKESRSVDLPPAGRFFSQLATYDVCPLAYRYKYIERQPELLETEAMFLGQRLHEALFFLYERILGRPIQR